METSNKIKRSELWENIREVLARLPHPNTNEDKLDNNSAAVEIESLLNQELIKRLDDFGKLMYEKIGTDSYEVRCLLHDFKKHIEDKCK